jgi:glycosyltransferase involved in cell wall biosynthesis
MGGQVIAAINTLSVSELNEGTRTLIGRLLPALREVAPEVHQLLVCSKANRHLFSHDVDVLEVDLDHRRVLRRILLDQWTVPRLVRGRADVLVNAAGVGSLLTRMSQVSIVSHHFALPSNRDSAGDEGPGRSRRLYYGLPFRLAMSRSAAVLGISEYLADGLVHELGADPAKVVAMPLGAVPPSRPPVLEGRSPLLLHVGTLYTYKDAAVAIAAFGKARPRLPAGARLAIVGKDPDGTQADRLQRVAFAAGVADSVELLGVIAQDELERLYTSASALVLASRYEGFGLPVAEAMARGTPVIVAAATSLPEVAGRGGITVPVGDVDGFAAAMVAMLTDEPRRLELARQGMVRAAELTWERTATILRDAILRAAGRVPISPDR